MALNLPGDPDRYGDPFSIPGGGAGPSGGGTAGFTTSTGGFGGGSPVSSAPGGMGFTQLSRRIGGALPNVAGQAPAGGGFGDPGLGIPGSGGLGGWGMGGAGQQISPLRPPQQGGQTPFTLPGGWGGNDANSFQTALYNLLNMYAGGGSFSPGGSQQLLNSVDQNARLQADALNQRANNASMLYGMDPSQAAAYRLQSLMGTGTDVANINANARYGTLMNQQQLAQQLLSTMLGYNNAYELLNRQYLNQRGLGNQNQQGKGFDWGSLLGLAGSIGGMFF